MTTSRGNTTDTAVVLSATPGRIRLKLRRREAIDAVRAALEAHADVADVTVNTATGSVLVRSVPRADLAEVVRAAARDAGVPVLDRDAGATGAEPTAERRIAERAAALDAAVVATTHGSSLRLLGPLALGALAARQAARGTARITEAPWYLLAWYAFDMFMKLNRPNDVERAAGGEA